MHLFILELSFKTLEEVNCFRFFITPVCSPLHNMHTQPLSHFWTCLLPLTRYAHATFIVLVNLFVAPYMIYTRNLYPSLMNLFVAPYTICTRNFYHTCELVCRPLHDIHTQPLSHLWTCLSPLKWCTYYTMYILHTQPLDHTCELACRCNPLKYLTRRNTLCICTINVVLRCANFELIIENWLKTCPVVRRLSPSPSFNLTIARSNNFNVNYKQTWTGENVCLQKKKKLKILPPPPSVIKFVSE